MHTLGKTVQRRLALGLLATIALLVLLTIVLPIWRINAKNSSEIDFLQTRLLALQTRTAADQALRPRHERLLNVLATSGHHLKSDTEAVAAAELQRIVKAIADKNATQVLTTQILPVSEESDFVGVALRVRMRGPLEGMMHSLYDIEANRTFLFIDNLSLRDGARRRMRGGTDVDQFDGEFDLIAYMPGTTL